MFKHEDTMYCSTCFEEMESLIHDDNDNPIAYICINCGKVTDITDEL